MFGRLFGKKAKPVVPAPVESAPAVREYNPEYWANKEQVVNDIISDIDAMCLDKNSKSNTKCNAIVQEAGDLADELMANNPFTADMNIGEYGKRLEIIMKLKNKIQEVSISASENLRATTNAFYRQLEGQRRNFGRRARNNILGPEFGNKYLGPNLAIGEKDNGFGLHLSNAGRGAENNFFGRDIKNATRHYRKSRKSRKSRKTRRASRR